MGPSSQHEMGRPMHAVLDELQPMTGGVLPISNAEFEQRLATLAESLGKHEIDAVYLHAGTNLRYFTGLAWQPSERLVGAILTANGRLTYVAPKFEQETLRDHWRIESDIRCWEEHESPYKLVWDVLQTGNAIPRQLVIDETTPYYVYEHLRDAVSNCEIRTAQPILEGYRSRKSPQEIELIQRAHEMTLTVIRSAASILRPGISTTEVVRFIDQAHRRVGAEGSIFCIVLFGVATSFPHGVKDPQTLQPNDWVLIDTGCLLDGYHSDITRTFGFGTVTDDQASAWEAERAAQLAAFEAAQLNASCESVDYAARASLVANGFGPDYQLPGCPHRTGHGCGLDIHEAPYIVRGNQHPLAPGMVFSIEPMLVIPEKFGVRLEDHVFITENGPRWFTEPASDPFAMP